MSITTNRIVIVVRRWNTFNLFLRSQSPPISFNRLASSIVSFILFVSKLKIWIFAFSIFASIFLPVTVLGLVRISSYTLMASDQLPILEKCLAFTNISSMTSVSPAFLAASSIFASILTKSSSFFFLWSLSIQGRRKSEDTPSARQHCTEKQLTSY